MGPNNKQRSRAQYVKNRLSILRELQIAPPPQDVIEQMKDESKMTETAVDAIFLGCIKNAR